MLTAQEANNRTRRDMVFLAVFCVLAFLGVMSVDAHDHLDSLFHAYGTFHLDDLMIATFPWILGLVWFAARRWRDYRALALEMERRAHSDGMTGLINGPHFLQRLSQELARANRYHRPLCLLMIDLDHFKRVNDTHGHLAGNRVLANVGRMLAETTRTSDLVARFGGEEFAVALPETGLNKGVDSAERIRQRVAGQIHEAESDGGFHVTCSIGIAEWTADVSSVDELVKQADDALYAAKKGGRNQVRIFRPTPQPALLNSPHEERRGAIA